VVYFELVSRNLCAVTEENHTRNYSVYSVSGSESRTFRNLSAEHLNVKLLDTIIYLSRSRLYFIYFKASNTGYFRVLRRAAIQTDSQLI
jgi:hypothetical protein